MTQTPKLTMANAHRAVIFVARHNNTLMAEFAKSGNPAVRKAAEHMSYLAGMADQETVRQRETADDVLYYLPMPQIEDCLRAYELGR